MLCKKIPWMSVESSFSNRAEHFPTEVRRFFHQNLKNCKSEKFFQKTNFPRKVLLFKKNSPLTSFLWFLRQCCRMFFPQSENSEETQKVHEKNVQSKISFGHIKCSSDEPAESSYRTPQTFFLNFRRMTWNFSDKKDKLTQYFSLTQHFLTKFRKFFHQYSENCKSFFFKNQIFHKKLLYKKIAVLTSFLEV